MSVGDGRIRTVLVGSREDQRAVVADELCSICDDHEVTLASSLTPDSVDGADSVVVVTDRVGETVRSAVIEVREAHPRIPIILFVSEWSSEIAQEAVSDGATDCVDSTAQDALGVLSWRVTYAVTQRRNSTDIGDGDRLHGASLLFERARDCIVLTEFINEEPIVREVNHAFAETFGCDPEEAAGRNLNDLIVPDEETEGARKLDRETLNEPWVEEEVRRRTVDGDDRDFLFRGFQTTAPNGRIEGYAVYTDVTERANYERTIEALHVVSRRLMEARTVDEAVTVTRETMTDVLGRSRSALFLRDRDDGPLLPAFSVVEGDATGTPSPLEPGQGVAGEAFSTGRTIVLDGDDERIDELSRQLGSLSGYCAVPIGDHGVLAMGTTDEAFSEHDVDALQILAAAVEGAFDRIERERQLKRRNEQLDRFASVVTHDLRNPLWVAQNWLNVVREDTGHEALDDLAAALDRMQRMVERTLSLARLGRHLGETEPVPIDEIVEECWRMIDSTDAELVVEGTATIVADRDRLRQLLENLLGNAVAHGGRAVTVRVGVLDDDRGFYVADDGPGIAPRTRENVFEAGFSTDEDGLGLGLVLVEEIVDAHGWTITVTESDGGGARFEIDGVESIAGSSHS